MSKPILITSAGARTGNAIARHLLEMGYPVILCYRHSHQGIQALQEDYPGTPAFSADLTDPAQVAHLRQEVGKLFPNLYGLINLVGDYLEKPILETSFAEYKANLRNNLDSVFLTCQEFYPLLKASPTARIINFGYSHADRIQASRAPIYQIAKHGVISLTKSLAKEWGPDQISVNVISPGQLFNSIVKDSENPGDHIPQGRWGSYEDLFVAIDMLLREDSTYLTGNNLVLSGGYNL